MYNPNMKKKDTTKKPTKKTSKKVETKVKAKEAKVEVKSTPVEVKKETPKKKFSYIKASIVVILIGLLAVTAYAFKNYFIVATVDGKPITRYEVIRELETQYGNDIVEGLVSKKLVEKEAMDKGITVSDEEVNAELEKIKSQTLAQGYDWATALSEQNLTEAVLKEQLKYQLMVQSLLKDELAVTDEDVNNYLEENKEAIGDQEITDEIRASVKQGLESQKASSVISPWLTKLKGQANINYIIKY